MSQYLLESFTSCQATPKILNFALQPFCSKSALLCNMSWLGIASLMSQIRLITATVPPPAGPTYTAAEVQDTRIGNGAGRAASCPCVVGSRKGSRSLPASGGSTTCGGSQPIPHYPFPDCPEVFTEMTSMTLHRGQILHRKFDA